MQQKILITLSRVTYLVIFNFETNRNLNNKPFLFFFLDETRKKEKILFNILFTNN